MLTVNGGIFKDIKQYAIKNIVFYKSTQWTSCRVKIKQNPYKFILAEDVISEKPYLIELTKDNNIYSLSCDNMIIHQQVSWFDFELEFTMASDSDCFISKPFYEYIIKDIIS